MFKDKTALITGASRGIGRGIACKFAEHGAFIGINYISNKDAAEETLKLVNEKGSNGLLLKGDVSKGADIERNVRDLVDKRERIDILVNNAGIYKRNTFENISSDTWNKIISVNLTGCYNLCQKVIPYRTLKISCSSI